jgi:pyruvate/2-oxoglutarate dehydrogenase complex dihydrolipoamide dehydrogenase (E3) component
MANRIGKFMEARHTKFIRETIPEKVEKLESGRLLVHYNHEGVAKTEEYDTVLFAIGRFAVTDDINPEAVGLIRESNGKFKVNAVEQTNVPHIYAIGDCISG